MNVKPLYNSANLPYLLFKSPKKRRNKPRTKRVSNPNEVGQEPERRYAGTRTKLPRNPNEDTERPEQSTISDLKIQSFGKIL
jgi:hypothetical protein